MAIRLKKIKKLIANNKIKIAKITLIAIGIIIAAVACFYAATAVNINIRKDRIISIFNSLKIDDKKYTINYESILGEKRIYEWDSSRSYSSERTYIRSADVDVTVAELKQAIAKTDFKFYEEPYPGSTYFMYIYKSPNNEYLRVSVDSKTRQDDFFNKHSMGLPIDDISTSPNAGPSKVTIKVNLDDNNE